MFTRTTSLEQLDRDMERAGLKKDTESLWGEIQKDLEAKLVDESSTVDDGSKQKQNPADDLPGVVKATLQDKVCSSKSPLNPPILPKRRRFRRAVKPVRETGLLRSRFTTTNTTEQDIVGYLLTGNEGEGSTKKYARIHPMCTLTKNGPNPVLGQYPATYNQRTPEHLHSLFGAVQITANQKQFAGIHPRCSLSSHRSKTKGDYPVGYNQRTPEHLHSLFGAVPGAVQTTASQETPKRVLCSVPSHKSRSKKTEPNVLGNYPKDYNKRTKEHLHFLFGAKSQPLCKPEEEKLKIQKRKRKERKNKEKKEKKNDKKERVKDNYKNDKGHEENQTQQNPDESLSPNNDDVQVPSTSLHPEPEQEKPQKGIFSFLRIGRRGKKLA